MTDDDRINDACWPREYLFFSESNVKETGKKSLFLKRDIKLAVHPAYYDRDA